MGPRAAGWLLAGALACGPGIAPAQPSPAASPSSAPTAAPTPGPGVAPPASPGARVLSPLDDLLARARANLRTGEPRAAWQLLRDRLDLYAGIPVYDQLLGVAALDAGLPGEAVLALERVLMVEPGNLPARAEIARAYLALKEQDSAREQFETVAAREIPPEARRVIEGYLGGIARREAEARGSTVIQVETTLGHDDNVNFGSASGQWLLADGTAVTPLGTSRPSASGVIGLSAGFLSTRPIGGGWEAIGGGTLSQRSTPSVHTLDQAQADASIGLQRRQDCQTLTMQANLQHLRVDRDAFRDAAGLTGQWRCDVDPRTQLGVFAQAYDFRYPDQSARDARRVTLGLTAARVLAGAAEPVLVASVFAGRERPRADLPQLDFRLAGVRASINARVGGAWRGWASVAWERRDHAGEEPLFGTVRHDRQTEWRLGAERELGGGWALVPQVIVQRNASTLDPNDFRRTQWLLTTRWRH